MGVLPTEWWSSYMSFKDQMQIGAGGAARLRLVEGKG